MNPRKPKQVAEIERRLRKNAKLAGNPMRRVCCAYTQPEEGLDNGEWGIGDNWEQSPTSLIYRNLKWWSRNHWDGEDKEYSYEQALGDTTCWFTG